MKRYNPSEIEPKWQTSWRDQGTYQAQDDSSKPKYYALSFFPYPSGAGLHLGHTRNFTITDVVARFKRMTGHEVMHPMGWDSFGLPGENYAIKTGIAPQVVTKQNEHNFRLQCQRLGLSIDWSREFSSTDPEYYKWTQWFFLLLLDRGLAYQQESAQFWCTECKTVLANEQVVNGCCWRHEDTPVTKKLLKQWFFKITDYADRLAEDLDDLDWPDGIKHMQRNWIGKSKGAEVDFALENSDKTLKVFTTRPDTLFGATFMVLAPEHPYVTDITTNDQKQAVNNYIASAQAQTDIDRMDQSREKTGVFTGAYAINPVTGKNIPIWIADYVLTSYGTGAIKAVPAHDERDFAFAQQFELPITRVIKNNAADDECTHDEGIMINSGEYDGIASQEAREKIVEHLAQNKIGQEKVNYKIRDWLISRQRYWGAPIPVVHCPADGIVAVPEDQLPVVLPEMEAFQPSGDGRSPLANNREWVETTCPSCGGPAERETDTMDGFACSSWYFMRFADPRNVDAPFSKNLVNDWLPVDMYVGGAEHAVMHLLYARMWTKVMYDAKLIGFNEPFTALRNQGMLLAEDGQKISKSKGNGIDPVDVIDQGYGADSLRMINLFLAPFDQSTPWSNEGLAGVYRFLGRTWTLAQEFQESNATEGDAKDVTVAINKATKKVTDDIHKLGFNTAIAALMECVNELYKIKARDGFTGQAQWQSAFKTLAQLLAPFGPHIAEELWQQFGGEGSVHLSQWPVWNDDYLVAETIAVAVQVNGKLRGEVTVVPDADQATVLAAAMQLENVQNFVAQKEPSRVIYVPGRLINIVV